MRRLARLLLPAILPLLLPAAAPAQSLPPRPDGDFGCAVDAASPCRGRVDFERGRTYEFRIAGPGKAAVLNEGNRRCVLEYSLTASTVATAGRTMSIAPGETFPVEVPDGDGVILRFFTRGTGSVTCDLLVSLAGRG